MRGCVIDDGAPASMGEYGGGGGGCCIALEMCEGLREYATTTTTTDLTGVSEEVKKLSEEGSPCSRPNR